MAASRGQENASDNAPLSEEKEVSLHSFIDTAFRERGGAADRVYTWELQSSLFKLRQVLLNTNDRPFIKEVAKRINEAVLDSSNLDSTEYQDSVKVIIEDYLANQNNLTEQGKKEFLENLAPLAEKGQKFFTAHEEEIKSQSKAAIAAALAMVSRYFPIEKDKPINPISTLIQNLVIREIMRAAHNRLEYSTGLNPQDKYKDAQTKCEKACALAKLVLDLRKSYEGEFRIKKIPEDRKKALDKLDEALKESAKEYSKTGDLATFRRSINERLVDIATSTIKKDEKSSLRTKMLRAATAIEADLRKDEPVARPSVAAAAHAAAKPRSPGSR